MMAMTKAEQAEMEAMRKARDLARSLRWPEYSMPERLSTADATSGSMIHGWDYNEHTRRINEVWSSGINHYSNAEGRNGSQGAGRLYATEADALRAMRIKLTEIVAAQLAEIDARIEAAS